MNIRTRAQDRQPIADRVADSSKPEGCWLREPGRKDVDLIETWFAQPEISQWFDFGLGRQQLSGLALQIMLQSKRHHILMFGCAGHETASGLVAVSDVTHSFGTGSFWVLRDASRPTYTGMTHDASITIIQNAFMRYRLHCITAWVVEDNARSQHLLERIGFRRIGTQRACHVAGDKYVGRVLYDLIPTDLAGETFTS